MGIPEYQDAVLTYQAADIKFDKLRSTLNAMKVQLETPRLFVIANLPNDIIIKTDPGLRSGTNATMAADEWPDIKYIVEVVNSYNVSREAVSQIWAQLQPPDKNIVQSAATILHSQNTKRY